MARTAHTDFYPPK